MLTLNEALRTDRLEDFISQAEAQGVEAADAEAFGVVEPGSGGRARFFGGPFTGSPSAPRH